MSTRKVRSPGPKDIIYWRYHWKKTDPVMMARKIGTVNWVLLRDKLNEMNQTHEKETDPHTLRAQIIASQVENMTRQPIPSHQDYEKDEKSVDKINTKSTAYCGGPYTKGMTPEERKQFFRTKLNQKAREGFRFWLTERPKPTKFGHYSMGAKYTFLGLCNAPRS
ncbi:unnamed protein product [Trichobilharzia szidati]|nr:unnamed protein product [Trichobilharzia szidati]CAH8830843.1 unnamed protein product [Trichobilharzia szidati]